MNDQYRTLLAHPLTKINLVGLLTPKIGLIKTILLILYMSCMVIIITLAYMQFFYMKWTILNFIDQAESCCSITQTFSKLMMCFWQKRNFLNLCEYSNKFWNTENCSEEAKKRISNLSDKILILQKGFFYACLVCIAAVVLSVFGGRKLPIGTWSMTEYDTLYKIDLAATNIAFMFHCFFIPCYDCLFVGYCFEFGNQFQILCDLLENLKTAEVKCNEDLINNNEKLNFYIRQHSFLIRYFKKMQETYSVTFMIQCITVVPMVCAEIVALSQDISLILMLRYGLSMYCIFMQIAFYCIPAEYVTSQAATISNGIYNSKWYIKSHGVKKSSIQMMMLASQQDISFCAMGIFPIKASTLVTIFKIAMSTKTLISNLDEK